VPNPRKRADLFEVARHSWLSEYAHVVEFITSATTTPGEIQNTTVPSEEAEAPALGRSASVREASKKTTASPTIGGLATKQGTVDPEAASVQVKQQRDNKRRTVQVEYVAPNTTTQRGESSGSQPSAGKTRARSGSQGPVEVSDTVSSSPKDKPLPRDPPVSKEAYNKAAGSSRRPPSAHRNTTQPGSRPSRETRAVTDNPAFAAVGHMAGRPMTGGSMQSNNSRGAAARASYAQPVPPELADTNVHGRIQQPPKGSTKNYGMASPAGPEQSMDYGRPSMNLPSKFTQVSGFPEGENSAEVKGHKRSSTMGEIGGKIFGRRGSIFGGKNRKRADQPPAAEKKKYPPISMNNALAQGENTRQSIDSKRSRRSFSIGLSKRASGSMSGSQNSTEKQGRRFSFIPGFGFKSGQSNKEPSIPPAESQQDLPIQEPPQVDQYGRYVENDVLRGPVDAATVDGMYAQLQDSRQGLADPFPSQQQPAYAEPQYGARSQQAPVYRPGVAPGAMMSEGRESPFDDGRRPPGSAPHSQGYPQQVPSGEVGYDGRRIASTGMPSNNNYNNNNNNNRGVLQKNKRFVDAWNADEYARPHDYSGSSGPARKVMDFFRRRGKARAGPDSG
jgi:protein-serine/threonine kinase